MFNNRDGNIADKPKVLLALYTDTVKTKMQCRRVSAVINYTIKKKNPWHVTKW